MMSNSLRREISWFLSGLLGALLISFAIGWPVTGVLFYLCGYVAWLLQRMNDMVMWLDSGAKPSAAPPTTGMTDDMVELIHREKKYSRKQKIRYRSTLAQFNSLAADLPDATVVLNQDFEIRWSNSAALNLLNIHPERDRGQRIDNLVRNPEFREFLYADNPQHTAPEPFRLNQLGNAIPDDSQSATPEPFDTTIDITTESQSLTTPEPIAELEMPGPTGAGRVLAVRKVRTGKHMTVLIAADITQRVQVREMRKAFVGDVSHELRTPLTVIRGYLEMLREEPGLAAPTAKGLEQISQQTNRMHGIVEDLLQLSRLEGDPLPDDEGETLCVADMIQSMVAPLRVEAPTHKFVLDLDNSLALLGSERGIFSACNNLLTNAIRYTDPGSTIQVSWHLSADGSARYSIADNGPGIEARHLGRLSERFYRVDAGRSRDDGGTGLGLAIVKHAAQRHGGVLEIRSTPGVGSQFDILFPPGRTVRLQQAANQ